MRLRGHVVYTDICHVVDYKFGGFSLTILMDFLNFVPASDGDELIIICEDTGRVNRLPLQSSKLLPHPLTRKPVVPPSPHWLWTWRKFL
jgi:hypothetical protein